MEIIRGEVVFSGSDTGKLDGLTPPVSDGVAWRIMRHRYGATPDLNPKKVEPAANGNAAGPTVTGSLEPLPALEPHPTAA